MWYFDFPLSDILDSFSTGSEFGGSADTLKDKVL